MNITEEEIASLEACKSDTEWNAACAAIKAARDGAFPPDWWPKVVKSGIMKRVVEGYGGEAKITISGV